MCIIISTHLRTTLCVSNNVCKFEMQNATLPIYHERYTPDLDIDDSEVQESQQGMHDTIANTGVWFSSCSCGLQFVPETYAGKEEALSQV